ncbi:phospholipase D-like domain-containing protein [Roseixanthobacter glucoisosaccharinicivorans]|uniref:phospholipase D-like domain-containing protein n=1 Tax=Roseixanthobacter glucoisosaccharinicivorans TaxID=3119923 RepID=UPI00372B7DAB
MLRFIREHDVAKVFSAAIREDKQVRIAVAFWGLGAAKKLGLSPSDDVQIVCNLDHVGCNPDAVQELLDVGIQVRTHRRLHGKVYATEKLCIVGSSNASTNGLMVEGDDAVGWKEANVLSDDPDLVRAASAFFDEMWGAAETRIVTASDIKAARARCDAVPAGTLNPPNSKTLIAACRERPDVFEDVIVIAYGEDLSRAAKKELKTFKEQAAVLEPSSDLSKVKRPWGYQVGAIQIGAWIIDLDCTNVKLPKIRGCSKSVGIQREIEGEELLTVTPRGVVSVGGRRYPIASAEKALLEAAGKQIMRAGKKDRVSLQRAIEIADRFARKQAP